MIEPQWMTIARGEIGVRERPGADNNLRILDYHAQTALHAKDDETPWCSAFVNWVLAQCNIEGTRRADARSWLTWAGGERCEPKPGAIADLARGKRLGWQGHVAFIDRCDDKTLWLLGGNQGNAVSIAEYKRDRLLGCRWPKQKEPLP